MESLTITHVNQFFENNLPKLIEKLTPNLKPIWGQMTPQHVMEHLTSSIQMSNGKVNHPIFTPEDKIERAQRYLYNRWGAQRNFKSPVLDRDKLPELIHPELETAKQAFWKEWNDFEQFFKENPNEKTPNPVFGFLNEEQWRRFQFKHFIHHMTQFGLAKTEDFGLKESLY